MDDRFTRAHKGRALERTLVACGGLALAMLLAMAAAAFMADSMAKAASALAIATGG